MSISIYIITPLPFGVIHALERACIRQRLNFNFRKTQLPLVWEAGMA